MTIPRDPDQWVKPSRSVNNADCVEVSTGRVVGVRDTKNRGDGQLAVAASVWSAFLATVKTDRD